MNEKRLISFRDLKSVCHFVTGGWQRPRTRCKHSSVKRGRDYDTGVCAAKNCPIWNRPAKEPDGPDSP